MNDVVVDVESVGVKWEQLAAEHRVYLRKRAVDQARWRGEDLGEEESEEAAAMHLALDFGLARVIAIGVYAFAQNRTVILLENTGDQDVVVPSATVERHTEAGLFRRFWDIVSDSRVGRIVTFNGRTYDGPLLTIRSAQLRVTVRRELVPYRYDLSKHCDLHDVFGFWGAVRGGYTLDHWCRCYGISSPKEEAGVSGSQVQALYDAGETGKIGDYVAHDVWRLADLYVALGRFGVLTQFKGGPAPGAFSQITEQPQQLAIV